MANFSIFNDSSTAQVLSHAQSGLIGLNGSLVTTGEDAVTSTSAGTVNLTVLGTLMSLGDLAVNVDSLSFAMNIGAAGYVASTTRSGAETNTVFVEVSTKAILKNAGTIHSPRDAVRLGASDTSARVDIVNSGSITGDENGVYVSSGSGDVQIKNTGEILGAHFAIEQWVTDSGDMVVINTGSLVSEGFAIASGSGATTIRNSGTIIGKISFFGGENLLTTTGGSITGDISGGFNTDTLIIAGDVTGDISAGSGNDILKLFKGTLTGTASGDFGDDTFILRGDYDIEESENEGTDLVKSWVNHVLGDHFENLTLRGGNDLNGTGNSLANTLNGNGGANRLKGHGDTDTINGKDGDDSLFGGAGVDTLQGGDGADLIHGGRGADTLHGNDGRDILVGGLNKDTMTGGDDADSFVFTRRAESAKNAPAADRITDFVAGQDVIDLSALSNGRFSLASGNSYSGNGPEILSKVVGTNTQIRLDIDGNGTKDMTIVLVGTPTLTESDFVL